MCINKTQCGISLIELIMFIVIISVALIALLSVLNVTTKNSTDPLLRKQALAIAESLLEEVQLQNFSNPDGGFTVIGTAIPDDRASFDDVFDYNSFATAGIFPADGSAIAVAGLGNYSVGVNVVNPPAAWGTIPANDVAQITVTVTDPSGQSLQAVGYRVNY